MANEATVTDRDRWLVTPNNTVEWEQRHADGVRAAQLVSGPLAVVVSVVHIAEIPGRFAALRSDPIGTPAPKSLV
jgi:hypothetical protein